VEYKLFDGVSSLLKGTEPSGYLDYNSAPSNCR